MNETNQRPRNIKIIASLSLVGIAIFSLIYFFADQDRSSEKAQSQTSSLEGSLIPAGPSSGENTLAIADTDHVTIFIDENGFFPTDVRIRKGTTITFENRGEFDHWPASDIHPTHGVFPEFDPKAPVPPGESWSFIFEKPGIWKFHDHIFPELIGSIIVEGDETNASSQKNNEKLALPAENSENHEEFEAVNLLGISNDEDVIRRWLMEVGPKKMMDELLKDSGNGSAFDCHQEAHVIGRVAYEMFGGQTFTSGLEACHSGFYHGAMEALLKEEGTLNLSENISRICQSFATSFGQFECLHGVGHGLMAYENYKLPQALNACELLGDQWSQSSCYGGVFMENIVAAQGFGAIPGHETKWVDQKDPHFPCNQLGYDAAAQFECYQMQTSWMLTMFRYDFAKVANECLNAPSNMISICYRSYGRDAAGSTLRDPKRIIELCNKVPEQKNYLEECVYGALNVIVDFWGSHLTNQATELCRLTADRSKPGCYQTLSGRLSGVLQNPAERKTICEGFETDYISQCLSITQG